MRGHVAIIIETESTISGRDVVLLPGRLPIFLHGCQIKSGWGLGTRLAVPNLQAQFCVKRTNHGNTLVSCDTTGWNTNGVDSSLASTMKASFGGQSKIAFAVEFCLRTVMWRSSCTNDDGYVKASLQQLLESVFA